MSQWWTYRPSDFLMFSPRIYWRLFESLNLATWPAPVLLLALGPLLWWLLRRGVAARGVAGALALAWTSSGWLFLQQRLAPIHWVAEGFALAFGALALTWLALALPPGLAWRGEPSRRRAALALWVVAFGLVPVLPLLAGRPWQQAEVFALAPDPTAIVALGVLLVLKHPAGAAHWLLRLAWTGALAWCAITAATLAVMGSAQALLPVACAALASSVALRCR